jgi:glycosyltransferase involved in cell wall biosynthesis
MDVLAISSELPWPTDSGGRLRSFHVLKAIAKSFSCRLIAPIRGDRRTDVSVLESHGLQVSPVPVPPRSKLAEAKRLAKARLRGEPYVLYARHDLPEMQRAVAAAMAEKPKLVWLDHLDSFLFHPHIHNAKSIIDLHNIYSLIPARLACETANPLKSAFFRVEAKRLARVEALAAAHCDAVMAVSKSEADYFQLLGAKRVVVAANGVDCAAFAKLSRNERKPLVLFLGTLNWGPNVGAAVALAREIFPQVRAAIPAAELAIVGRDPCAEVKALAGPGVTVYGSVPDVKPYLAEASLLAVPLDSGGGTRLKILEAFAAGLTVVSTAVGAEGIDAANGDEIAIAERPAMAAAIIALLKDESKRMHLAARAKLLAEQRYDWAGIGETCVQTIRDLINA